MVRQDGAAPGWSARRFAGALASVKLAAVINAAICLWAKPTAPDFVLLTPPVVVFWTVVGSCGIIGVYAWLEALRPRPFSDLLALTSVALGLTVLPDFALLIWPAKIFGPYSAPAIWVLIGLHATCALAVLASAPLWLSEGSRQSAP